MAQPKNEVQPFGYWFAERVEAVDAPPLSEWNWKPQSASFTAFGGSLPGTTGTGPDAKQDEGRDEM